MWWRSPEDLADKTIVKERLARFSANQNFSHLRCVDTDEASI
jgi:hypothetical protein